MSGFLTRRLTMVAVLLLGVSMLGFLILHLAPGGPLSLLAATGDMSQQDIDRLIVQMGLNASLPVQCFHWLVGDW